MAMYYIHDLEKLIFIPCPSTNAFRWIPKSFPVIIGQCLNQMWHLFENTHITLNTSWYLTIKPNPVRWDLQPEKLDLTNLDKSLALYHYSDNLRSCTRFCHPSDWHLSTVLEESPSFVLRWVFGRWLSERRVFAQRCLTTNCSGMWGCRGLSRRCNVTSYRSPTIAGSVAEVNTHFSGLYTVWLLFYC